MQCDLLRLTVKNRLTKAIKSTQKSKPRLKAFVIKQIKLDSITESSFTVLQIIGNQRYYNLKRLIVCCRFSANRASSVLDEAV